MAAPLDDNGHLNTAAFVTPTTPGAYVLPTNIGGTCCLGRGDDSKRGSHCDIKSAPLETKTCNAGDTRGATCLGWTCCVCHVLRKCTCNFINALRQRHGAKRIDATRDLWDEVSEPWAKLFESIRGEYAVSPMRIYEIWLAKWAQGKQKSIRLSRERDRVLGDKIKAMIKRECYHRLPKKARLIQFYRTLATQAEYGPEFYALQKVLCSHLNQYSMGDGIDVTFASGMNADDLTTWMLNVSQRATHYLERDGANWDSTMGPMAAAFRQRLYKIVDPELAAFAELGNEVDGFGVLPDGVVRYRMCYGVKSGHNDTTLGNSILNAAIAMATMRRLGMRGSIIVAGDDLLIACHGDFDLDAYIRAERDYGIVPEAAKFSSPNDVTFCSGMFFGPTCAYVPIPGRLLKRLWWTTKPPHAVEAYRRGVARGLMPACHDIPIVRQFLAKFDSDGAAGVSDKGYKYIGVHHNLGADTIKVFAARYGVDPDAVRECEEWLRGLPAAPLLLVHPLFDRIFEVDEASIESREKIMHPVRGDH